MKLLRLSTALSAAVISLLPTLHTANSQEADYACFMTTKSGQVIDLSESICGLKKSTAKVIAKRNRAFSNNYKDNVPEREALGLNQASEDEASAPSAAYIPR